MNKSCRSVNMLLSIVCAMVISAVFLFRRLAHEPIDDYLTRFEVVIFRANNLGGFTMHAPGRAWLLLNGMELPPTTWIMLLMPFDGRLPATDDEVTALTSHLRRQGHLFEKSHNNHTLTQQLCGLSRKDPRSRLEQFCTLTQLLRHAR